MSMELQLSTAKAEERLKSLERALANLETKLTGFSSGAAGGFTTFTNSLQQLQAIPTNVATTIEKLSKAAAGFQNAGNISTFANNLSKLQGIDLSQVARQVQTLVTDLARVRVPANMSKFVQDLRSIASASNAAASGLRSFNAAASNVKAPAGLPKMKTDLDGVAVSAKKASSATAYFGTVAGNLRAGLVAVGIAAIGREMGQFVKSSYEAQLAYDKFNAIMNNTTGPKTAAAQFDFIRKVANETATDLNTLMETYPKFAMNAIPRGFSGKEVGDMFNNMAIAVRGFGLSTVDANLAMNAIVQMMTKGQIMGEEFKQQLAERGVPAMAALEKATGKLSPELLKLMEAGKLGTDVLQDFITAMGQMAAPAVVEQMKNIGAQMTLLNNQFTIAKLTFSDGFTGPAIRALQALNAALAGMDAMSFFSSLGQGFGFLVNVLAQALAAVMMFTNGFVGGFQVVVMTAQAFFDTIANSAFGVFVADMFNASGAASILGNALQSVGIIVGAGVAVWLGYRAALLAVVVAKAALLVVSSPLLLVLSAIAAALALATGGYEGLVVQVRAATKAAAEVAAKFGKVEGTASDAASALVNLKDQAQGSAGAMDNAANAAQITDTSLSGMGARAASAANIFDELKVSADSAASAIQGVNSAASSAPSGGYSSGGGGGGGGGVHDGFGPNEWASGYSEMWEKLGTGDFSSNGFSQWRDGGIVSKGNRAPKRSLPISAFAGAPRFATGGTTVGMPGSLPDGGIPSILHPNEAVIPLANGSVPVELSATQAASGSGGNGGAASTAVAKALERGFSKANSLLTEINKGTTATKENINQVGVVIKSESDRHMAVMNTQTSLLTDMVTKIEAMRADLNAMKSSGGSGGGSGGGFGGGSGGSSGGSGVNGTWTDQDEKDYQAAKKQYEKAKKLGGSITQNGGMTGSFNAKGYSKAVQDKIAAEFGDSGYGGSFGGWGGSGLNMNYTSSGFGTVQGANAGSMLGNYFEDKLAKNPAALGGGWSGSTGGGFGMSSGFAKGSPNVFEEAQGRSAIVRVHPDEAVVPLPDGRRIPVDFGDMSMPHAKEGGSGGRGDINVTITVNAKDADSFRASEDQMLQRMQQKLNRAIKNLGDAPIVDDPTVRPGSR